MRTPFLLLCFIHLFFQEHEFSVLNLFQISRIADGIAVIVEADIPRYALIIHLIQCVSQIHACQHILRPVQTFQCCHHRHIGIIAQRGNRRNLVCAAVQRKRSAFCRR